MSRIGNRKLTVPAGVTASVEGNIITVSGSKGKLDFTFEHLLKLKLMEM